MRTEGQPPSGDPAVDEAYAGFGATWSLFHGVYGRDSLDGRGLPLLGTVHYGRDYDNAFWDGTQMVFGDGDGRVNRFTIAVDVIGHELTHGLTEHTAALEYQGQSGALNESLSDVFGSLVKDPQPTTMDGFVETTDDNGGVHINSGIPNHAFYLAATAIGGNAWDGAGRVWFDVLAGGQLPAGSDFATFAAATVAAAQRRYAARSPEVRAVREAWDQVGVGVVEGTRVPRRPAAASRQRSPLADDSSVPAAAEQVRIRRRGGLAGIREKRTVALQDLPEPDAADWRSLLDGNQLRDLAADTDRRPIPGTFTYHLACPADADEIDLPEHGIPQPVRDLFQRTLRA